VEIAGYEPVSVRGAKSGAGARLGSTCAITFSSRAAIVTPPSGRRGAPSPGSSAGLPVCPLTVMPVRRLTRRASALHGPV
jgi:hypothetical protein